MALVPRTKRLRIGRSNFRLPSNIQSKESTLQVVYDVLHSCPFFKAFLVTADVSEIYMQEFWATAYVHQHSIRFKLDNKKHIVILETFRDMLYICPRIPGQSFDELPFEEEILEFLWFLGHSAQIKTLTDVNINKLFQPWRSFRAVINKCLTGKSSGFDSFSMLNPTSDVSMESIFATASSSLAPLPTPTPTMTPSIITTITIAIHPPIPPTPIPSEVLQNLPTFDSVFHFDERLKSLEANFSEYRQTNPF
nr:hypothetical protein [Tanacetum cinerariifolium]